jgi:hypothetical protein
MGDEGKGMRNVYCNFGVESSISQANNANFTSNKVLRPVEQVTLSSRNGGSSGAVTGPASLLQHNPDHCNLLRDKSSRSNLTNPTN